MKNDILIVLLFLIYTRVSCVLSVFTVFQIVFHPNVFLFLHLPPLPLLSPRVAFARGCLVVMESLFCHWELWLLMRLLSHTLHQINRLQQPITTRAHQPGPWQTRPLHLIAPAIAVCDWYDGMQTMAAQLEKGDRFRDEIRWGGSLIKLKCS